MSDNELLGPDGKPLRKSTENRPLPIEIEALVESKVNTAMDSVRETLRREASNERRQQQIAGWIKYGVGVVFAVLAWVFGSSEVRDLTKKYVDEHMNKPALEEAAKEVVTNKMAAFVSQNLQPLQLGITNAAETIKTLTQEQKLIALLSRAETLDPDAFEQLTIIAGGTNEMARLATAMVRKIERSLFLDKGNPQILELCLTGEHEGEPLFKGPFTSDEFAIFLFAPSPREAAVNSVATEKRILFVPRLVELAHTRGDLSFLNRVSLALERICGVRFAPYDVGSLDRWWAVNKTNYTEWPFTDLSRGISSFASCNYAEALRSFEAVIAADPSADMSRAYAAVCATQLGDMSKAHRLNTGYIMKDGRWEKWAKSVVLLATGATDQATTELAALSTAFPMMRRAGLLTRGSDFLRTVNWTLFEKLTAEPANPKGDAGVAKTNP